MTLSSRRLLGPLAAAVALVGVAACGGPAAPAPSGTSSGTSSDTSSDTSAGTSAGTSAAAPSPAAVSGTSGPAPVAAVPQGLVPTTVTVPAGLGAAPLDTPRQVLVPPGWTMSVWARTPGPRLEAWTPDGKMLVSRPEAGEVDVLTPDGRGGSTSAVLLAGLTQPHGLAFAGTTLYVAESDAVRSYTYGNGTATAPRDVVVGLPDSKSPDLRGAYAHALKSVAVGPDGAVYVSVGSTANVSPQDRDATPIQRAAILRVPPGGGPAQPFVRGVRNGTGLAIAPDGTPWTAVNNRDQIAYPFDRPWDGASGSSFGQVIPSYVGDHPSEELAALTPGRDLGWPYCNPDPDPAATAPGTLPASSARPPFDRDVQTNADGSKLDCSTLAPIEQTFGAHSAPLGLAFGTLPGLGQGAIVGVHGSWNRTPPRAPEVSFFPWSNGTMGAQQTLVGGFQATDGSRWGRPVAAVPGPDGAVYVSDDSANAIYRLVPPGRS